MEEAAATSSSKVQSWYGSTVEDCQKMIDSSLRKNNKVKFMREALAKAGCSVGPNFFKARPCDVAASGGFAHDEGVVVCSNHVALQDEVDQVIIHELIHAYDHCRAANLNWSDCEHHACSEIRAANLSGDCHYKREFLRGYFDLQGHHMDCVRRRSLLSVTAANPDCTQTIAEKAIDNVWDTCLRDTQPFDRVP